eukprot:1161587-Pelagomonas_calceolata.AAC.14
MACHTHQSGRSAAHRCCFVCWRRPASLEGGAWRCCWYAAAMFRSTHSSAQAGKWRMPLPQQACLLLLTCVNEGGW